jgi:hypothetical protein
MQGDGSGCCWELGDDSTNRNVGVHVRRKRLGRRSSSGDGGSGGEVCAVAGNPRNTPKTRDY